jgi:hypothetical protein
MRFNVVAKIMECFHGQSDGEFIDLGDIGDRVKLRGLSSCLLNEGGCFSLAYRGLALISAHSANFRPRTQSCVYLLQLSETRTKGFWTSLFRGEQLRRMAQVGFIMSYVDPIIASPFGKLSP